MLFFMAPYCPGFVGLAELWIQISSSKYFVQCVTTNSTNLLLCPQCIFLREKTWQKLKPSTVIDSTETGLSIVEWF